MTSIIYACHDARTDQVRHAEFFAFSRGEFSTAYLVADRSFCLCEKAVGELITAEEG
jgi:hypothetical protein